MPELTIDEESEMIDVDETHLDQMPNEELIAKISMMRRQVEQYQHAQFEENKSRHRSRSASERIERARSPRKNKVKKRKAPERLHTEANPKPRKHRF